jgi:hypothetical protein
MIVLVLLGYNPAKFLKVPEQKTEIVEIRVKGIEFIHNSKEVIEMRQIK